MMVKTARTPTARGVYPDYIPETGSVGLWNGELIPARLGLLLPFVILRLPRFLSRPHWLLACSRCWGLLAMYAGRHIVVNT